MSALYLAYGFPGCGKSAALRTHSRAIVYSICSNRSISASVYRGCTTATLTSPTWRAANLCRCAPLIEDTRDRSYTCPKPSRAFSPWASSPLSPLAHSRPKKNSSWSSRSRPNRFRPASTSNLFKVATGQAVSPVPLLSQRDRTKGQIDLCQSKTPQIQNVMVSQGFRRGDHTSRKGRGLSCIKQKRHSVLSRLAGSLPAASRNHQHRLAFSRVSRKRERLFARTAWSCRVIFASLPRSQSQLPLVAMAAVERRARLMGRVPGRGRVLAPEQDRVSERVPERVQVQVPERVLRAHKAKTRRYHSSIPQAASGWVIFDFAACGAVSC